MPHPCHAHWPAAARALPPNQITFYTVVSQYNLCVNTTYGKTTTPYLGLPLVLHTTSRQFYPVNIHTPRAPPFADITLQCRLLRLNFVSTCPTCVSVSLNLPKSGCPHFHTSTVSQSRCGTPSCNSCSRLVVTENSLIVQ